MRNKIENILVEHMEKLESENRKIWASLDIIAKMVEKEHFPKLLKHDERLQKLEKTNSSLNANPCPNCIVENFKETDKELFIAIHNLKVNLLNADKFISTAKEEWEKAAKLIGDNDE